MMAWAKKVWKVLLESSCRAGVAVVYMRNLCVHLSATSCYAGPYKEEQT